MVFKNQSLRPLHQPAQAGRGWILRPTEGSSLLLIDDGDLEVRMLFQQFTNILQLIDAIVRRLPYLAGRKAGTNTVLGPLRDHFPRTDLTYRDPFHPLPEKISCSAAVGGQALSVKGRLTVSFPPIGPVAVVLQRARVASEPGLRKTTCSTDILSGEVFLEEAAEVVWPKKKSHFVVAVNLDFFQIFFGSRDVAV